MKILGMCRILNQWHRTWATSLPSYKWLSIDILYVLSLYLLVKHLILGSQIVLLTLLNSCYMNVYSCWSFSLFTMFHLFIHCWCLISTRILLLWRLLQTVVLTPVWKFTTIKLVSGRYIKRLSSVSHIILGLTVVNATEV